MGMEVTFKTRDLERLWTDPSFTGGLHPTVVRFYRMRIQFLSRAADERDIRSMKSLRFEKLKGKRQHQRSIRINDQMRIVFEVQGKGQDKRIEIASVEDYH